MSIVGLARAAVPLGSLLRAQAARYPLNLAGARFSEQVRSDVATQSGSAERHRTIERTASYSIATRADTLVVTADSLGLAEIVDGARHGVDVDAVIGGRWKLGLDARGAIAVVEAPFVPGAVADVSDLGSAMDDFFPIAPPQLAPGAQAADSQRTWRRLPDSAARRRYHWSERRHSDSTTIGADSVHVHAVVDTHDEGDVAWDVARGPVAWLRRIQTTVTSRFAGRTVRAVVDQRVSVRRLR